MKNAIKNVNDIRDRLEILYLNAESGHTKASDVKEMTNVAGKIINSAKLQLEYNKYIGKKITIEFLTGK